MHELGKTRRKKQGGCCMRRKVESYISQKKNEIKTNPTFNPLLITNYDKKGGKD